VFAGGNAAMTALRERRLFPLLDTAPATAQGNFRWY